MYIHPSDFLEYDEERRQRLIREAEDFRADAVFIGMLAGRVLAWLGMRLSVWGRRLQRKQQGLELEHS